MLIHYDPYEWEGVIETSTCPFHQAHPGEPYAGCACSTMIGSVRRSPEEVAEIKARKRREHEDHILAEAEAIKLRRKSEPPEATR